MSRPVRRGRLWLRSLTVRVIVRAVEPSAVAARRTRTSLALAVGGAIVLMAGVALILTGEAMKLEHPVHPRPLIVPGLIFVVLGFALGVSAIVTILLDAPTRLPSAPPVAEHAPGDPPSPGQVPDAPASFAEVVPGEVLSSFRLPDPVSPGGGPGPAPPGPAASTEVVPGAALPPPGRAQTPPAGQSGAGVPPAGVPVGGVPVGGVPVGGVPVDGVPVDGVPVDGVPAAREPLAAEVPPSPWFHAGQPGPGHPSGGPPETAWAGERPGGEPPGSAWPRDPAGGGLLPQPDELPGYADAGWDAGAASSSWPDPPAEPPHEIHHPVRR
jgi:hypothetical protein